MLRRRPDRLTQTVSTLAIKNRLAARGRYIDSWRSFGWSSSRKCRSSAQSESSAPDAAEWPLDLALIWHDRAHARTRSWRAARQCGSALAAHSGKPQGRPFKGSGSRPTPWPDRHDAASSLRIWENTSSGVGYRNPRSARSKGSRGKSAAGTPDREGEDQDRRYRRTRAGKTDAAGFLPDVWIPDAATLAHRRQVTRRSQLVRQRFD